MPSNFESVAIGSEISEGVRNIFIYNCDYDAGPEKPEAQVKIIGAQADIVYDDAKQVKLTNFRP
ncbi:hypothetical protein ACFL5Z_03100 [Planctomycetota bacterium]